MQQQQESGGEESWLEEQCHSEINGQNDEYEREFVRERDNNLSTVWGAFQDSATAVAQLYRGKLRLKLQLRMSSCRIYPIFPSIGSFCLWRKSVCVFALSMCVCVLKNSLGEGINSECAACLSRPDRQQQQQQQQRQQQPYMHTTGPAFKLYACMCACTYVNVGACENLPTHTQTRSTPKNSPHSYILSLFSPLLVFVCNLRIIKVQQQQQQQKGLECNR